MRLKFPHAEGPYWRECHGQTAIATLQRADTWVALKKTVRKMLITERSSCGFGKGHDYILTS